MSNEIVCQSNADTFVVVFQQEKEIVEVIHRGIQGPPGDSSFFGFPFDINNVKENDLLAFSGSSWINKSQDKITDGGNF